MPLAHFKASVPYDVVSKIAEYLPGKSRRSLEATSMDYFQLLDFDYKDKLKPEVLYHQQSQNEKQSYKDLFLNPANRKAEFVGCDKAGQHFIEQFTRNGFFTVKQHFISIENPGFGKYVWSLGDPQKNNLWTLDESEEKPLFRISLSLLNAIQSDGTPLIRLLRLSNAKHVIGIFLRFFPHIDPNVSFYGDTPLLMAVRNKQHSAVAALLDCPTVNVNVKSLNNKNSALILAILNDDCLTVELLLKNKKTNLNLKNADGKRPLEIAILYNRIEIVQALLKRPDLDVNFLSSSLRLDMLTTAISLELTEIAVSLLNRKDLRYDYQKTYNDAVNLKQNVIADALLSQKYSDLNNDSCVAQNLV